MVEPLPSTVAKNGPQALYITGDLELAMYTLRLLLTSGIVATLPVTFGAF